MVTSELITAFVDDGLGNSSYLIDLGHGRGLVVDPARDATPYLAAAERAGLSVAYSVETHLHADFLTGSRELASRGAMVLASNAAGLEWPHRPCGHGDEIDLGGLRLRALATPGHTPEHLAWLLIDGARPLALFSGGALLVGAVARTDLISPEQTEPLARDLWRSLQQTILALPDELPVYPTHGAGSFCAATKSGPRVTTIGRERTTNPLLAADDEDAFVKRVLEGYGSFPPYFLRLRERNRRGPDVVGSPFPPLEALTVAETRAQLDGGAVVIDVRPAARWSAAHVPASISIPLRDQFASWLGWLFPDPQPMVFVIDPDQDDRTLVRQARTIGHDQLVGYLGGGIEAWRAAGLAVRITELIEAPNLDRKIVDVRQTHEFADGHVPGALHIELGDLARQPQLAPSGAIAVMCGHGERAATAASLLERGGRTDVAVVTGGPSDWASPHRRLANGR